MAPPVVPGSAAEYEPAAHASVSEAAATPQSWLLGPGSGLSCLVQRPPSRCSMSVCQIPPESNVVPTAQVARDRIVVMALSCEAAPKDGVDCVCQFGPGMGRALAPAGPSAKSRSTETATAAKDLVDLIESPLPPV